MNAEASGVLVQSYSPATVKDIRDSRVQKNESNQDRIGRLAMKYAIDADEVRRIMGAVPHALDERGRARPS